jgi:hypothetical protein
MSYDRRWSIYSTGYTFGAEVEGGRRMVQPRATISEGSNRAGDGPWRIVAELTGDWFAAPASDPAGAVHRGQFLADVRAMVAAHNAALEPVS